MKKLFFYQIAFIGLLFFNSVLIAQQMNTVNGVISLTPVNHIDDINQFVSSISQKLKSNESPVYITLSFKQVLSDEDKVSIESCGLNFYGWVPDNVYIVSSNTIKSSLNNLVQKKSILPNGIGFIPLQLKLSKALFEAYTNKSVWKNYAEQSISLSTFQEKEIGILKKWLSRKQIDFSDCSYCGANALLINSINYVQFKDIISSNIIASVDLYQGEPHEEGSFKLQANQIHPVNYLLNGPTGRNTFAGNYERYGAWHTFSLDFHGRKYPLLSDSLDNSHGTRVINNLGAADNYDEYESRGMAPGCTSLYLGYPQRAEDYYLNKNIKPLTSNHSVGWGAGEISYDNAARELDRITRSLGGYLHGYSAGNTGGAGPFLGYPAGWANISGNIKVNKNNFTTHSSGRPGDHFEWTSKGPCGDGRLKPDICAEGNDGSSHASPATMGLVNVLYESYTISYGTIPRSDVVKAVILNTAYETDKTGIDFKTGFGTINPLRAHQCIQGKKIFTGTVPSGSSGSVNYSIQVPPGLREAKILLYWHDYPGTVGANKALVNDLDIIVTAPDGSTVYPWVLNPSPATVYDLPKRKRDTLNNVEQITIDNPMAGNYKINVKGNNVPMGPQDFVVTYDLIPYHIKITNPVQKFKTGRGKQMMFTWNLYNNQTNSADSIDVYLQKSSSQNFTKIASLMNKAMYFEYVIPNDFPLTNKARIIVKQRNTNLVDTSGYFQVMLTPGNLSFTTICSNELTLKWDTVLNTGGKYIIYKLGDKYMEAVDSVLHPVRQKKLIAATILGPGKSWSSGEWFAVAARHNNGSLSLRSYPISTNISSALNPANFYFPALIGPLCYGDTVNLSSIGLIGDSIKWFKNNTALPGKFNWNMKVTSKDTGVYFFTIYNTSCAFSSPKTKVMAAPVLISDTAVYGVNRWMVYTFKGKGITSVPYYGNPPKYYGSFSTDSVSINSHIYYAWSGSGPHNAPGYIGCAHEKAWQATTVWKRKGFKPGTYTIDVLRAADKFKMTINNGTKFEYTSPTNAFTVNNIWTGNLDGNSTIRFEHSGSHINVKLTLKSTVATDEMEDNNNSYLLYPNPINNSVTIQQLKSVSDEPVEVTIWNVLGVSVYKTIISNTSSIQFNLSHLPEGAYVLHLRNSQFFNTFKINKGGAN